MLIFFTTIGAIAFVPVMWLAIALFLEWWHRPKHLKTKNIYKVYPIKRR